MSNYNTTSRSRLYTVDYRIKGEKDKIGPTSRKMKENNKKQECTEIPGMAAHCACSTFAHWPPDIPTKAC